MAYAFLQAQTQRKNRRYAKFLAAASGFLGKVSGIAKSVVSANTPVARRLSSIPLTLGGTGFIDFAAFHLAHGWGWLVTGISLIILEHVVSDDGGEP